MPFPLQGIGFDKGGVRIDLLGILLQLGRTHLHCLCQINLVENNHVGLSKNIGMFYEGIGPFSHGRNHQPFMGP